MSAKRHKYLTFNVETQAEINRFLMRRVGYDEILDYLMDEGIESSELEIRKYEDFLRDRDLIRDVQYDVQELRNAHPEERIVAKICSLYEAYIGRIEAILTDDPLTISLHELHDIVNAITKIRNTRVSMESVEARAKQEAALRAETYESRYGKPGVSPAVVNDIYEKVLGVHRNGNHT